MGPPDSVPLVAAAAEDGPYRLLLAAATAFAAAVVLCPAAIACLRRLGLVERTDKCDAPWLAERHRHKRGTATMGGAALIAAALAATAAWGRWEGAVLPALAAILVLFGVVGSIDDVVKTRHRTRKGLGARTKVVGLGLIAGVVVVAFFVCPPAPGSAPIFSVQVPFLRSTLDLGPAAAFVALVALLGTANAVNLTDGLDGLATGLLVLAFGAFGVLGFVAGSRELAARFGLLFVPGGGEAAVFAAAVAGAGLAFLLFNRHPARLFLGDTGALAMGGALGMVAVALREELGLIVIGGVFVAETLSVILQVWSWKRRRKRLFRCTPLHHHFECLEWPERRITRCFWLAGAACFAVGLFGLLGV